MSILRLFGRKALLVQSLSLATLLCVSGCQPEPPPPPRNLAKINVAKPLYSEIVEWDDFVGRLEPTDFVEVRARVNGYLEKVFFEEGQIVKKDQVLCLIDPRPFKVAVEQAQAEVENAISKEMQAAAAIPQVAAEVEVAEARLELANRQFRRTEDLVRQNAGSTDQLDISDSEKKSSLAALNAAKARLSVTEAARNTAKVEITTARAALDAAMLDLKYCEVRSPIDGRISSRQVAEGNLISGGTTGSTLITNIVSLRRIHCVFDVDESSYLKYERLAREGKMGSSREVKNRVYIGLADEDSSYPHAGHVDFVDNRLDFDTGTMRIRAIFNNDSMALTPGLFTRVRIPGSAREMALLIPDSAIGTDQSQKFIMVLGDGQKVSRKIVELGPMYRGLRIIRDGLSPEDQVVTSSVSALRDGVEIEATLMDLELKPELFTLIPDPVPENEWISRNPDSNVASAPRAIDQPVIESAQVQ